MSRANLPDPQRRASLLCELGRHSPGPLPIWNNGYYFSACRRCGRDIVRPFQGRWQTPRGYQVVWQRDRPASETIPVLAKGGDTAATPDQEASPIVLPDKDDSSAPPADPVSPVTVADEPVADATDATADALPSTEPASPATPHDELAAATTVSPAARRSTIPDFMNERSLLVAERTPATAPTHGDSDRLVLNVGAREVDINSIASFASKFSPLRRTTDPTGGRHLGSDLRTLAGITIAVLLALLAYQWLTGTGPVSPSNRQPELYRIPTAVTAPSRNGDSRPSPEIAGTGSASPSEGTPSPSLPPLPQREVASEPSTSRGGSESATSASTRQVVTASVLNCRKSPAPGAPVSMKMLRGVEVSSLGRRGDWTYVLRRGNRCWVKTELLGR